jgi:hypothetical protein
MKAFPNHRSEGMDLRDYFAGQAMLKIKWDGFDEEDAADCYRIADAMMKARENNEQTTT